MRQSSSALLAVVAALSVGCASFQTDTFRARSSGDSNQESLACKGKCEISTTIDSETGAITGWKLTTDGGEGVWHTGKSANNPAEIIDSISEALGKVAEGAAAGASPAPKN